MSVSVNLLSKSAKILFMAPLNTIAAFCRSAVAPSAGDATPLLLGFLVRIKDLLLPAESLNIHLTM